MKQKTALISGAGIAGPATAYWLNAAGWQTTVVECAEEPRKGGYVIDFWGLGYDLAERMGLLGKINRLGYHVGEVRFVGDHGERLAGFGTSVFDELTGGRFVTIARSELSRLLLKVAAPATELIFGDEIVAVDQSAGVVIARLASGSERRVDLVVGADGLRSRVRRLVFGPDELFEKPLGYAVAAFEAEHYGPRDPDVYLMYCEPGRMLGRFTLHRDRSLFLFVFTFEGDIPASLDARKALLASRYRDGGWETAGILRQMESMEDIYLDKVSQILAPSWSNGRVVLVGDAGFCVSLLAGQGSALAIVAAFVLAGELASSNGAITDALARYEALLRPHIATKQSGARRFAGAFAPRTRSGLLFRNLVVNALGIPGLARLVVGREITDRLTLPNYPLSPITEKLGHPIR
jgi:2-polyprenyl-6-methoxyphenol hydroxylase-like FAD-dependent oxidoreductase